METITQGCYLKTELNGSVPGSVGRAGEQIDRCSGEEAWLAAVHGPATESQVVAALTLIAHLQ